MNRRTAHSLLGTLVLLGILVIALGLDWPAVLWAQPMQAPPPPAPTWHWERVGDP